MSAASFRRPTLATQRGRTGASGVTGPAKLVFTNQHAGGRGHVLSPVTVIGRSKDADLLIEDPEVSRNHARITFETSWRIEDLGSRNGTRVNGRRIKGETVLTFGDQVQLGDSPPLIFTHHDSAEEQLMQRQRMETLGRLSAGVAHDFNNMVGAIIATQEYLLSADPTMPIGAEDVQDCLAEIGAAATRAAELTPRLLGFVNGRSGSRSRFDLSKLCDEVVTMASRTFDRAINVVSEIQADLFIVGDRVELFQVLMNLCVNARDAMSNGGILTVALVEWPDNQIVIRVTDTGAGMSEDVGARIFEPFFSTKGGKGFGLGLASAKQMVELHGGEISVRSAPGHGSCFRIRLPMATHEANARTERTTDAPPGPPRADGVRVLLVDDDALCRKAYSRMLESGGYEVVAVPDGHAALQQMRTERPPEVVVLDLNMQGLSGEETLRMIRYLAPRLTVIVLSGDCGEERLASLEGQGISGLIQKPCATAKLLTILHEARANDGLPTEEPTVVSRRPPKRKK